jgi:hypothetical protein
VGLEGTSRDNFRDGGSGSCSKSCKLTHLHSEFVCLCACAGNVQRPSPIPDPRSKSKEKGMYEQVQQVQVHKIRSYDHIIRSYDHIFCCRAGRPVLAAAIAAVGVGV